MLQFLVRRGGGGRSTTLWASKSEARPLKQLDLGCRDRAQRGFASSRVLLLQTSPRVCFEAYVWL